jgi:hypothetical protein
MCRGRRARILLHLHIQLEGTVLRGSRACRRFGCRNHDRYVILQGHADLRNITSAVAGWVALLRSRAAWHSAHGAARSKQF